MIDKEGGANRPLTEFEKSVIRLNYEVGIITGQMKWVFRVLTGILLLIGGLYLKGS